MKVFNMHMVTSVASGSSTPGKLTGNRSVVAFVEPLLPDAFLCLGSHPERSAITVVQNRGDYCGNVPIVLNIRCNLRGVCSVEGRTKANDSLSEQNEMGAVDDSATEQTVE